jgi:GNAT superfamily N-acetyltransferase
MVEMKPMSEDYILLTCLHKGPVDTAAWEPSWNTDPSGLPPHPWSDETLRSLVAGQRWITHGNFQKPEGREFMREMIQRYGTCALLAWEGRTVIGFVRFYPMKIARLAVEGHAGEFEPVLDCTLACEPDEDEGTLWVQCVMTCAPYTGVRQDAPPAVRADENFRAAQDVGARKGIGLKLARAVVPWAREHGWKRIIKVAHPDLDFYYGIWGGGGKAFWEKAGFTSIGTIYGPQDWSGGDYGAFLRAQAAEKGMTEEEAWTFHRMACEF